MSAQPLTPLETTLSADLGDDVLVPLSAKSAQALPDVAARLARHLEREPAVSVRDVAFTYQTGKAHHAHRAALAASSREDLVAQCHAFATRTHVRDARDDAPRTRNGAPRVAFLFTGQGAQYAGMGAELYRRSRVFRESIDRCAGALDALLPYPLRTVLFDRSAPARINETEITQPALFALEYALAQQWIAWGFVPDVVIGHSLGEWVAACIAGAYRLEDACALVFQRGALMQRLCKRGAMASVAAPAERVAPILKRHGAVVTAYNTPDNFVVGGEVDVITALLEELERMEIRCKRLSVSHAFHSPLMEPMLAPFAERVGSVRSSLLTIPLISNLDGRERAMLDAEYWTRQIRNPVRFTACLETLADWGGDLVVEIGPQPVLAKLAERALPAGPTVVHSLRREHGDVRSLHESLGRAWCAGIELPWAKLHEGHSPRRVHVPTYPYQRESYTLDAQAPVDSGQQSSASAPKRLLDAASDLAAVERVLGAIWRDALGVKAVTAESDFSALGADSLDAVGLLARTKQVTGVPLTLEEQYKERTLGAVARLIHERLAAGLCEPMSAASEALQVAPAREDFVPPTDRAVTLHARDLAHVVVAGATGYLGAHVVKELYDTTAATIDCLVGVSGDELETALRFYFGVAFVESSRGRIRAFKGELAREGFGLGEDERAALGASVDTIFDLTAADASSDNKVDGLAATLRFVAAHPGVRLHVASLLGALEGTAGDEQSAGASFTLHRVGNLVGHATTGRMSREIASSPLYAEIGAMVVAGVVPDGDAAFDLTPVDYAASAIVELAKQGSDGRTFHVCNPRPLELAALHDSLRALGYSITAVSPETYASWREAVVASGSTAPTIPRASVRFACETTQEATERAGVHCPSPDRDLVFRILQYGIELGYFSPPPRWGLLIQPTLLTKADNG